MTQSIKMRYNLANDRSYDQALKCNAIQYKQHTCFFQIDGLTKTNILITNGLLRLVYYYSFNLTKELSLKRIITITIMCFLFLGVACGQAAADINNIRATIYSWQEAWQSKDINRYKLFYSKKFKSDGFEFQGWMNKKEKIFAMPGTISIELFDLEINTQNDQIIATFIQRYKSATLSDDGEKKIVLIQSDDMYKIISEKFVPLEKPTPSDEESLFGGQTHQAEPKPVKPLVPKYPTSPTPIAKRPVSESTINLTKLMRAPSLLETMHLISEKDEPRSIDMQKGEWRQVRSADGKNSWINAHLITGDAVFSHKKISRFTPKAPEPKVEEAKPTGIRPVDAQLASDKRQTVISKTSLEWLYLTPSTDSKRVERLTEGKTYLAVKNQGDWVGLQLDQESIGWTHQKHLGPDASGVTPSPRTMSAPTQPVPGITPKPASKPSVLPPIPKTTPTPISKSSQPPVSHQPPEKEARSTQTIQLVTPKVSFARAYEKPTIDSIILFRLKQDKRYIITDTKGDWYRIEDDNGLTGWGHRTLFMNKIETADVSVTTDHEKTKKPIPDVGDLPPERTLGSQPDLAPDTLTSDVLTHSASSSKHVSTEKSSKPAGTPSPFAEDMDKKSGKTELPKDKPPLFPKDDESAIAPQDEPVINQKGEQKEIKPFEDETSSDENTSQLTIKNSNQLTPTLSLVRVHAKPSTDTRIMFWLTKGKTYTFTNKKDGWYHIQLADGRTGWAHSAIYMNGSRTKKQDNEKSKAVSINKKITSVVILGGAHENPTLDSKVTFRLEKGETYTAEKKQGSWYLIRNANGDTGWAHKSLFDESNLKPIDEAKNMKRVNDIRFEAMLTGEEKVLFSLSGFYPPNVFLMEESQSTLVCDFSEIRSLTNLKSMIDINQHFVKRIRTEMHKDALRVSIDLTPGKSYDVRQVFFKKENLFTLIFSTNEN